MTVGMGSCQTNSHHLKRRGLSTSGGLTGDFLLLSDTSEFLPAGVFPSSSARLQETDGITPSRYRTNLWAGRQKITQVRTRRLFGSSEPLPCYRVACKVAGFTEAKCRASVLKLRRWSPHLSLPMFHGGGGAICERIYCILNGDKGTVSWTSEPSFLCRAAITVTLGDRGRDVHEYSCGNFLIKELSSV